MQDLDRDFDFDTRFNKCMEVKYIMRSKKLRNYVDSLTLDSQSHYCNS